MGREEPGESPPHSIARARVRGGLSASAAALCLAPSVHSNQEAYALSRVEAREGYSVELFASERDFPIENPVALTFDAAGKLWVLCMPGYPHPTPGVPASDRLVVLEDTDADGRADAYTVFADDLELPTGFELGHGGVYVAAQSNLLFLQDTDGDGRADTREVLLQGFGTGDSHHSISAFTWGPDGALYFQEGTFHKTQVETPWGPVRCADGATYRFEPRRHFLEVFVTYPYLNPWGHVFDRWGQDFLADASDGSNYFALPLSGHLPHPQKHPRTGSITNRVRPTGNAEIVSSRHFPPAEQGDFLITNVIGFRGVMQHRLRDEGSGFGAEEVGPLVFSSDLNFRPVDLQFAPDGSLYVADWFNPLIGHMQYSLRDPRRDHGHGRIWRVTRDDLPLVDTVDLTGRPVVELLEALRAPESRTRYRARRELAARPASEVEGALRAWVRARDPEDPNREHARLEGLWVGRSLGLLDGGLLDELLASDDARVRAAALRVLRHAREDRPSALDALALGARDPHPRVRLEAVVALSHLPLAEAAAAALECLRHPVDEFLEYGLRETLRGLEPHWRERLVSGEPFLRDHPLGLARLLRELETDELASVAGSPELHAEVLARHDADEERMGAALRQLASERGAEPLQELVEAIRRVDESDRPHADHALQRLFSLLQAEGLARVPGAESALASLRAVARRSSTKQLVTAAAILARGSAAEAWERASNDLGAMRELLEAAPWIRDEAIATELAERIATLAFQSAGDTSPRSVPGRYVRIELPGDRRTLTVAELEVFSNGENVARGASASQSTEAWGGVPERAFDGNTSGTFGDGGQTHTLEDQPYPWLELDLGREFPIESLVLWNRTDAPYGTRLEGFDLSVLDASRDAVFALRGEPAPERAVTYDLSDPELAVRRLAIATLVALGVRSPELPLRLTALLDDPSLRVAAVRALARTEASTWTTPAVAAAESFVRDWASGASAEARASEFSRSLRALGEQVAATLPEERRSALRRSLRTLGPVVLRVGTIRDAMLYDREELTVEAGREVELIFENTDIMPHNLLVTRPGRLAQVGKAAEAMAALPDAWARGFVPDSDDVLWATGLVQPGESEVLRFRAPDEAGDHPFVCTFPGHWIRMNGVLRVVDDPELVSAETAVPSSEQGTGRTFQRQWSTDDLVPFLGRLSEGRSLGRGRSLFEEASCIRCHRVGGEGGRTGPELLELAKQYTAEQLLEHLIEPSEQIPDEYRTWILVLREGGVVSGMLARETEDALWIQIDPYQSREPVEVGLHEIEERIRSDISTMPSGLLSTFDRNEILDLVAYLQSL